MVDIATVSVVSSSLVALGTIAVTFIGGERQRSHEADLDFEKRVWEDKSKALFTVIQECRGILDSDDPLTDDTRQTWALYLSKRLDAMYEVQATIEAFASTACREALSELIEAMRSAGVKEHVGKQVDRYRTKSREVPLADSLDSPTFLKDLKERRRYDEWAQAAEERAAKDFAPDLADLNVRAQRLLEAARQSVRRATD